MPKDGYVWWYVDAVSDDGEQALTMIAFVGSVFSPYYAWARSRGPTEPLDHCALNVALYRRRGKRWAMTERSRSAVVRTATSFQIGPSSLIWDGSSLSYDIDEWSVPVPTRIRGQVRIWPTAITEHEFSLDSGGHHRWRPIAPCARVEVQLGNPSLRWSGDAYWDSNAGTRPLEADFVSWNWSRTTQPEGASILYEGIRRSGDSFCLALHADPNGGIEPFEPPEAAALSTTRWWRIARSTRADGGQARVLNTLEDTPFYSRSLLSKSLRDQPVTMVHESLSLDRFSSAWVRCLLPFRMPRRFL